MKIIKPSVELYPQEDYTLEGIYKQIEKCARVSYKSEDKITETSSKVFVDNLIKAGHYAPLEFGTVYLKFCNAENTKEISRGMIAYERYKDNPYSKISYDVKKDSDTKYNVTLCVSTNYRVIIENNWLDDLPYLCEPTEYHYKRYCVKFITDIGAAREFTRHRVFSFMQESTRYCNYSKGKFGSEVTFIEPYWFKSASHNVQEDFTEHLGRDEEYYIYLSQWLKPQEIRQLLPLSTKTELVMCGFEDDWKHFFDLRLRGTTGAPHPDAKYLAQETWNLFKDNYDIEL